MPTLNFDHSTGLIYGDDCECTDQCIVAVVAHMRHLAAHDMDRPGFAGYEWDGTGKLIWREATENENL